MAAALAFVVVAVQYFFTFFTALKGKPFLATLCHSLAFSALTHYQHALVLTSRTYAFVAGIRARMRAVRPSFFIADLATGMRG